MIVVNAVILGLETDPGLMALYGGFLTTADQLILSVFVLEILTNLYAFRLSFFRNPWHVFDFVVVGISLMPQSSAVVIFRALRVLRAARLFAVVPQFRQVAAALLKSIPGIISVAGLMLLLFYIFAVMATVLYSEDFPRWFGHVGASMYSLFQIMTLESWSMGIVRPVMEVRPYAWAFFVPFIFVSAFTMLNLIIGIIVDTIRTLSDAESAHGGPRAEAEAPADRKELLAAVKALQGEVAKLKRRLD